MAKRGGWHQSKIRDAAPALSADEQMAAGIDELVKAGAGASKDRGRACGADEQCFRHFLLLAQSEVAKCRKMPKGGPLREWADEAAWMAEANAAVAEVFNGVTDNAKDTWLLEFGAEFINAQIDPFIQSYKATAAHYRYLVSLVRGRPHDPEVVWLELVMNEVRRVTGNPMCAAVGRAMGVWPDADGKPRRLMDIWRKRALGELVEGG